MWWYQESRKALAGDLVLSFGPICDSRNFFQTSRDLNVATSTEFQSCISPGPFPEGGIRNKLFNSAGRAGRPATSSLLSTNAEVQTALSGSMS